MSREDEIAKRPEFPWLSLDNPAGVEEFLHARNWLNAEERFLGAKKAGEGNMNLTLRVRTDRRTLILKQARPWVEKYDHFAAPWDRMLFEQRFYEKVSAVEPLASRMPRFLAADPSATAILLEDLPSAKDLSSLYAGDRLTEDEIDILAAYIANLHQAFVGKERGDFENKQMRTLNHEHIFVLPLKGIPGLDLDALEPGLGAAAEQLRQDSVLKQRASRLGERYLANGNCLLHGDYFPGSWLRTAEGIRIIDPEFCFFGDPEFDVGVAIAHLILAGQTPELRRRFLSTYASIRGDAALDLGLTASFAGMEIIRRLIGVAQLPIPATHGARARWLELSRRMLVEASLASLEE